MTRRARVPAPFQRIVSRPFGPRVVLLVGASVALVLLGGSGYLLSHITQIPAAAPQNTPATSSHISAQAAAEVLGAATADQPASGGSTASASTNSGSASAPAPLPNTAPVAITVQPSFSIAVDTTAIQHTLLGSIYIPFTITRQGGLSTPIVPGSVQISSGGKLTDLLTVQSAVMLGKDNGAITLLPVGLFPHDIAVTFFASSGSATASTNFSYHINQ